MGKAEEVQDEIAPHSPHRSPVQPHSKSRTMAANPYIALSAPEMGDRPMGRSPCGFRPEIKTTHRVCHPTPKVYERVFPSDVPLHHALQEIYDRLADVQPTVCGTECLFLHLTHTHAAIALRHRPEPLRVHPLGRRRHEREGHPRQQSLLVHH